MRRLVAPTFGPRQPQDTEMMFQNRNWYNFTWLSGDYNVEQHVHTLDKANWIIGLPQSAWGMGARSVRVDQPAYGDIYDQMSVTFDYPNGVKVHSCCRQINGCFNEMQCRILGTKGHASAMEYKGAATTEEYEKVLEEDAQKTCLDNMAYQDLAAQAGITVTEEDYNAFTTANGVTEEMETEYGKPFIIQQLIIPDKVREYITEHVTIE